MLQRDWRPFFTHTLYQQQGADTHFADTSSDFALLSVIYSVMDKNIKMLSFNISARASDPHLKKGNPSTWINLTSI